METEVHEVNIPDGTADIDALPPDTGEALPPTKEESARKLGWKPKEEFIGEADDFVEAEDFLKQVPLRKKMSDLRRMNKRLEKTIQGIAQHYNTNIELAKKKALEELDKQRDVAIEIGDKARVKELEQEAARVHQYQAPVEQIEPSYPEEIETFLKQNKDWFGVNIEMTEEAKALNVAYLQRYPGKLQESLDYTLNQMKKLYPEAFKRQTNSEKPPSKVDSGGSPIKSSGYDVKRLTPEQKLVYNQLVKQHKALTHEAYFQQLEDAGYLEG